MEQIVFALEKHVPIFMLVVARTMALTLQTPYLGSATVPGMARISIALSLAFFYLLGSPNLPAEIPLGFLPYALLLIREFLVGILFGFCANIILVAIQAGGEIIDVQIGLSMVMQFNPQTRQQSTVIGKFMYQLGTIVLISSYAHLFLLSAFFKTFEILPIGTFDFGTGTAVHKLIEITAQIFSVGVQISLPIVVVIFVVDFGLGMMNRVAPQINILELNFAMKPTTGMLLITVIFATLISVMHDFSYKMSVNAQGAITAVAEGIRWQQHNQNQKHKSTLDDKGLPPDFPIFRPAPEKNR
jgi:flagellar biosynthetic protein FliR